MFSPLEKPVALSSEIQVGGERSLVSVCLVLKAVLIPSASALGESHIVVMVFYLGRGVGGGWGGWVEEL